MEVDMFESCEQSNGQANGFHSMQEERNAVSSVRSSATNEHSPGMRASRPTRENVLKRLSEALMRHSLTKIDLSQRGLRPSDARLVKMALFQNSHLSTLNLGYNNLGDEGVTTLAPGIAAHKALASLDLGFNNIGDEGCRALAAALVSSSCSSGTLHTLYLSGNSFREDGALAIAEVIRRGCSIKKLHLTGNCIGPDGVAAITEAIIGDQPNHNGSASMSEEKFSIDNGILPDFPMSSGLQELYLGGTGMGPSGCAAVARMLECSTTIRVITLANCAIGDSELEVLASSIKRNRTKLPLEALQLSFNEITCKGLESLMNAIWGSQSLRELLLDNNNIGDRGAHQVAAILPHVKTLQVLDLGFNSIKSSGMRTLMKVVAETDHLVSLSVSGNPIDTAVARDVAYALAYNRSLKSLSLVHCSIEREGQRHIVAGVVSNRGIALRKLSGFHIAPVIVTIGFPAALENWTNEQVLNFLHLMWEQAHQDGGEPPDEKELDPLHFLPDPNGEPPKHVGRAGRPLDATVVVEVAKRAFESVRESGPNGFLLQPESVYYEPSFASPLAEDAIILEGSEDGFRRPMPVPPSRTLAQDFEDGDSIDQSAAEALLSNPSGSFVAAPATPAPPAVPDPSRKRGIVDWLCKNIQHLNELSQRPFSSTELWKLHQHFFTPVVNETGGNVSSSPTQSLDKVSRIVSSVPDVGRKNAFVVEPSTVTPSTQSSDEYLFVPSSEPSLPASPPVGASLPMLKRKVSYRFLGEAAIYPPHTQSEVRTQSANKPSVSKLIEDHAVGHSMPPKMKRARRNKTRISFLPRIKDKLDSYLDSCHDKALILMRQLFYVEQALLSGKVYDYPGNSGRSTHLFGVMADDAQMILLDMM